MSKRNNLVCWAIIESREQQDKFDCGHTCATGLVHHRHRRTHTATVTVDTARTAGQGLVLYASCNARSSIRAFPWEGRAPFIRPVRMARRSPRRIWAMVCGAGSTTSSSSPTPPSLSDYESAPFGLYRHAGAGPGEFARRLPAACQHDEPIGRELYRRPWALTDNDLGYLTALYRMSPDALSRSSAANDLSDAAIAGRSLTNARLRINASLPAG